MDDDVKQRVMAAILTFNVVIIGYQVIFNLEFSFLRFMLGALIAGVVAAGVYFAVQFSQK